MQTLTHSNLKPTAMLRGFTLVEVLMAVLVLAIALTGMMHMHLTALRAQRQSSYQISAMQLASDMAEMIRAWRAPNDDRPFLFEYRRGASIPAASDCTGGAVCDPSALREYGVARWLQAVKAALPQARVGICRDAQPWDNHGNGDAAGAKWACSGGSGAGIVIKLGWRREPEESGAGNTGDAAAGQITQGPQFVLQIGEPVS
jgi:type IV pilus assembly protein PilV